MEDEAEAAMGSLMSNAGGVITSAGEMGLGSCVPLGLGFGLVDRGIEADDLLGAEAGVGETGESLSSESSFSQTMSGVQILSGRERTTRGGARSASLCLAISARFSRVKLR